MPGKFLNIKIPPDWWPSSLQDFSQEDPLGDEFVTVAEISEPWGKRSDKILYTALVPPARIEKLSKLKGCIGYKVESSGPWPSPSADEFKYSPHFWVHGALKHETLEPLVVSWETAGYTVLQPDPGFLMTYGLIPRQCDNGETYWDDPQNGIYEVVKVAPPAEYYYTLLNSSKVSVRREYLMDYAKVRNLSLLQVYFVSNTSLSPDKLSLRLASGGPNEVKLLNRLVDVRKDPLNTDAVLAQIWGFRHIADPSAAPVVLPLLELDNLTSGIRTTSNFRRIRHARRETHPPQLHARG